MSRECDTLARLKEVDVNVPDLSATTFDTLAQNLPHQVHDSVHQDHEHLCEIENEQSVAPSEPTQYCAGVERDFARTIKLLERHRQPSSAGEFALPAQIFPSTPKWQEDGS